MSDSAAQTYGWFDRLTRRLALRIGMWVQDRGNDIYLWAGRR